MKLKSISVKMAWLLRHCRTPQYIQLNGGWADVKTIVSVLKQKFPEVSLDVVKQIVAEDEKGRYSFDKSGKITPNYRNSVPASGNDPVYPAEIMHTKEEDGRSPVVSTFSKRTSAGTFDAATGCLLSKYSTENSSFLCHHIQYRKILHNFQSYYMEKNTSSWYDSNSMFMERMI